MNFLDASVGADGRSVAFAALGGQSIAIAQSLQPGLKLVAGLRPEHLSVEDGAGGIRITAGAIESTGSMTYVSSANDELTLVQTRRSALQPGDTLNLTIDPALVHLFERGDRQAALASGSGIEMTAQVRDIVAGTCSLADHVFGRLTASLAERP